MRVCSSFRVTDVHAVILCYSENLVVQWNPVITQPLTGHDYLAVFLVTGFKGFNMMNV